MARCEVCDNDYYLSFQVIAAGQTHNCAREAGVTTVADHA